VTAPFVVPGHRPVGGAGRDGARERRDLRAQGAHLRGQLVDLAVGAQGAGVGGLELVDHPAGRGADREADQADPEGHQEEAHDPPLGGHRIDVAVPDGGHGDRRPPQGVAVAGDLRVGSASLGVEEGEAAQEDHQDRCGAYEHREPGARQSRAIEPADQHRRRAQRP
jgi:hypothetical protein